MTTPLTHITIASAEDSITALANDLGVPEATPGVYLLPESTGIFGLGPSTAEARKRAFADGSVLNLRKNRSGKVLNLKLLFSGPGRDANLVRLQNLIASKGNLSFWDSFNQKAYVCQNEGEFDPEYDSGTDSFTVAIILSCEDWR